MANPLIEFKDLFLAIFLTGPAEVFLPGYFERFAAALEHHYGGLALSSHDFSNHLAPRPVIEGQPRVVPSYAFTVSAADSKDSWKIKLHQSEAAHVLGGITSSVGARISMLPALASSLVTTKAAEAVGYASGLERRTILAGSKARESLGEAFLTGTRSGLYFFLKTEVIPDLHTKFRWVARTQSAPWFESLSQELRSILGECTISIADTPSNISEFLTACDRAILSAISYDQFLDVLRPSGLTVENWLDATKKF